MKLIPFLLPLLLGSACSGSHEKKLVENAVQEQGKKDKAEQIIGKVLDRHGSRKIAHSKISFDFRGTHYIATREDGNYAYERIFTGQEGQIHDILTNAGLTRSLNGQLVTLTSKDSAAYASSINSVIYFALLPYFLQDPAVQKEYFGEATIKGHDYHKIRVTFKKDGGGKDFQDQFMYWIDKKEFTMDYLAYNYHTDGGGARFRKAYNIREEKGLRFADYLNYKPKEKNLNIAVFDKLFQQDGLEVLSKIETENIRVE